jgi:hypothetical protein
MLFFRVAYFAMVALCATLIFTHGFWFALGMWAVGSILLWAVMTLVEMFVRVGDAITKPHQHVHLYFDQHSDPTRPDPTEDVHPIIVINEAKWKERNQ